MDGQLDILELIVSKSSAPLAYKDGHALHFTQYGTTAFITLVWNPEKKVTHKVIREYQTIFANAISKLKLLGIHRILSSCNLGDNRAKKFNLLFGMKPLLEKEEHLMFVMEIP